MVKGVFNFINLFYSDLSSPRKANLHAALNFEPEENCSKITHK
jgi:hypothetical protein